jgi:hypothetical protein
LPLKINSKCKYLGSDTPIAKGVFFYGRIRVGSIGSQHAHDDVVISVGGVIPQSIDVITGSIHVQWNTFLKLNQNLVFIKFFICG